MSLEKFNRLEEMTLEKLEKVLDIKDEWKDQDKGERQIVKSEMRDHMTRSPQCLLLPCQHLCNKPTFSLLGSSNDLNGLSKPWLIN